MLEKRTKSPAFLLEKRTNVANMQEKTRKNVTNTQEKGEIRCGLRQEQRTKSRVAGGLDLQGGSGGTGVRNFPFSTVFSGLTVENRI